MLEVLTEVGAPAKSVDEVVSDGEVPSVEVPTKRPPEPRDMGIFEIVAGGPLSERRTLPAVITLAPELGKEKLCPPITNMLRSVDAGIGRDRDVTVLVN